MTKQFNSVLITFLFIYLQRIPHILQFIPAGSSKVLRSSTAARTPEQMLGSIFFNNAGARRRRLPVVFLVNNLKLLVTF
jgi:hypothetical protein